MIKIGLIRQINAIFDTRRLGYKSALVAFVERQNGRRAEIMSHVMKEEISAGKDPMGLAASVLYLSSIKTGEAVTQISIAEAAGVTEVTVRNRFKDLKSKLRLN